MLIPLRPVAVANLLALRRSAITTPQPTPFAGTAILPLLPCSHGLRPPLPDWPPPPFLRLITSCWATDPALRPDFLGVIETLEDLQAQQ